MAPQLVPPANREMRRTCCSHLIDALLDDDLTRQVKAGLSSEPGIYLDFDPERAEAAAR